MLSLEEQREKIIREQNERADELNQLQLLLHNLEEKRRHGKSAYEAEIAKEKQESHSLRQERETLLNLVDASRIESVKIARQSDVLAAESLKHHRELEQTKLELSRLQKTLSQNAMHSERLELAFKEQLSELNRCRVDLFQAKLFMLSRIEGPRLESQASASQAKSSSQSELDSLSRLEKEKSEIKEAYLGASEEYQLALRQEKGRKKKTLSKSGPLENSSPDEASELKKAEVEKAKKRLVELEREIFVKRKKLQEQGI